MKPPASLLAIDSGHPECAVAVAEHGVLVHVDTVTREVMRIGGRFAFDCVVVEVPTLRGGNTPNPEDLLLIAIAGSRLAGRFAGRYGDIREYRPAEWKGSTPKPPHHARMWRALNLAEQTLLGGFKTFTAIEAACLRGAKDRWQKPGAAYYRARELPTVNGIKITHDILDAAALALYDLRRIKKG
jgi:hypothetical protein